MLEKIAINFKKLNTASKWNHTAWYPKIYRIIKMILLASCVLLPVYCMLIMEYMNFGSISQVLYWQGNFPLSVVFGVIVVSVIFAVLLLMCRKAVIAGGILGAVSAIFGYINYVKVATNGDNFFPRDIAMAGNAGDLTSFISGDIPRFFWPFVVILIIWLIALLVFNIEIPVSWKIRVPVAVGIIFVTLLALSSPRRAERLLYRFDMNFFDAALQSSNYATNGFVGAFTINLLNMRLERPENYSSETILAILEGFEGTPATKEYFDVIVVLSESFFDVRMLDAEFSINPLPNFDDIISRPTAHSGMVYTTALSGGTIRPEFDILTGLTTDFLPSGSIPYGFIRGPMATYVSNYRDAGYRTIGLHPFTERFYLRHIAYPLMGFDKFLGYEGLSEMFEFEYSRGFVTDISFFNAMRYYLDAAAYDDVPIFMFAITMQSHQPFGPMPPEDIRIQVTSNVLSENVLCAVTTFTQGLHDADIMLGMLVDYIDNRDRPTIMLFFGDHLPNLGGNLAAFIQSGLIDSEGLCRPDARAIMYSTPFVIYSNRELVPILSNLGNHISTYYLLSVMAYQTGFHRTAYMNFLLDYFQRIPFHNGRLHMPETDDSRSLSGAMRLITYDRLVGRGYSVSE